LQHCNVSPTTVDFRNFKLKTTYACHEFDLPFGGNPIGAFIIHYKKSWFLNHIFGQKGPFCTFTNLTLMGFFILLVCFTNEYNGQSSHLGTITVGVPQ